MNSEDFNDAEKMSERHESPMVSLLAAFRLPICLTIGIRSFSTESLCPSPGFFTESETEPEGQHCRKQIHWPMSPATMVRMSARYGHFGLEDLRDAVETISRPAEVEIDQRSPVNSPGMSESRDAKVN